MRLDPGQRRHSGLLRSLNRIVLLVGLGCFQLGPRDLAAEPEIKSIQAFYEVTKQAAEVGPAVRIRGTVLAYDAGWNQFYLHDGERVAYFAPSLFTSQPRAGDQVDLTGQMTLAAGGPALTNGQLVAVGRGPLPPPRRLALAELGQSFGEWVESSGRVRVVDTSWGRVALLLRDKQQSCLVFVMGPVGAGSYKALLDNIVRVRGINASKTVNGRLESASITVPGMEEVAIVQPAPALSNPPLFAIGSLLNRELGSWTNGRVGVNGLVSSYIPGKSITVRDPTGLIRAEVIQMTTLPAEARVNLRGFLTLSATEPVLSDAYFELMPTLPDRLGARRSPPATLLEPEQALTNAADILRLRKEEAAQRVPVQLRGVMTYADPAWKNGFIQDATAGIYVDLQTNLHAGDWVDLSGTTGPGGFAPEILDASFQVLGTTNFPVPVKAELRDLASGHLDARWIEMEGVVRRVSEQADHWYFSVMTRQGPFRVLLPNPDLQPRPVHLIDAVVRFKGACGSTMNARGQLSGITLHVPSQDHLEVLTPGPADPLTVPATPLATIATLDRDRLAGARLKVNGVVTLIVPTRTFFIQDSSGAVRVDTDTIEDVRVGDQLDVLGFPALGDFSPRLEEATFRKVGRGKLPPAKYVTSEQILFGGRNDGAIVSIEARLLQSVPRSANPLLVLQDGPIVFTARKETAAMGQPFPGWRSGSVLRLTGVCSIQASETREPKGFRLLLRGASDVQLVQAPPWWTTRHTLSLAFSLTAVIGAALSWVALLHRQVRVQTDVIRRELDEKRAVADSLARERNLLAALIDHLPDNVYVKDVAGRYVLVNQPHARFHGQTDPGWILGKTSVEAFGSQIGPVCAANDDQVLREGSTIRDQENTMTDGAGNLCHLLTTKVPLRDGAGLLMGLLGISRDVTERHRAEAKLKKAQSELLQASRMAGMAEVATSVLHNVGNVLNSLNVSSTLLNETAKYSKLGGISRIAALLLDQRPNLGRFVTEDPRGKQIPDYLKQLGDHLLVEQDVLLRETELIRKNVEHINEIVAMQQNYAKVSGLSERVPMAELVEDALRLNASGLQRTGVKVIRQFDSATAELTTERHKVLQILVNLIRNAVLACQESGRADKQLLLRIDHTPQRVQVDVIDNGVGILPENLTRIFSHGFTTRKHGHGFGLHSGALAARELGGTLLASSPGAGQGATFTLELPIVYQGTHHGS
ncbi:MAG: PAS domain-containing protein [Verrucomicrobiota bacterium]